MWARKALAKFLPAKIAKHASFADAGTSEAMRLRSLMAVHRKQDMHWLQRCLTNANAVKQSNDDDRNMSNQEDVEDIVSGIVRERALEMFEMLSRNITPGFMLKVKPSSIGKAAGDGLFVVAASDDSTDEWAIKGTAAVQPGDIVALYPGTVFFKEELEFYGGVNAIFRVEETSHFIMRNADGILIDGLGKTLPLNNRLQETTLSSCVGTMSFVPSDGGDNENNQLTELLERIEWLKEHGRFRPPPHSQHSKLARAYAMAHKANHPPPGTPANVIPVQVDFNVASLHNKGLCEFLPTDWALQPTGHPLICEHTICFVASREIHVGGEVWLDYRTSPGSRPPWFVDAVRLPYSS